MVTTDRYLVHGTAISVQTDGAELRSAIHAFLGPFATDLGDSPVIQCHLTSDPAAIPAELSLPPGLRPLYVELGTSFYRSGDRSFVVEEGGAMGVADPGERSLALYVPTSFLIDHTWCTQHNLFRLLLLELLRTVGIFPLHAAAAALDGIGVLVPAFGGGGKSTFSIALTRAGLRFLGDDVLLLRREAATVVALSLPDEVSLCPESLDFFPELAPLRNRPRHGHSKVSFQVPEAYPGRTADRCGPRVIVFPRIAQRPSSRLEPVSRVRAWTRLLPQSLWSVDSPHGREHCDLLTDLVQQCATYEIAIGTDLEAAAALVVDLLKEEHRKEAFA